ncbi:MAG TPA: glycosyltransferase family 1 protein [Flavitalea sp.]|nr:glycosyltransferase family 1 protein [Flavitalea sp.]
MIISIYADNLRVFTSMMPQRGLLIQYIEDHPEHQFVFYLHSRFREEKVLSDFFGRLSKFSNWSLRILKTKQIISRAFQLLGYPSPILPNGSDVYISPDIETFGKANRPVINFLADMTVFDDIQHTSLSPFNSKFRRKCITGMSRRSDLLVVVSKFTRQRFLHYFPENESKTRVLYNGIDDLWFSQPAATLISINPYWIWMGGSFTSRKNLERLLEAYGALLSMNTAGIPEIQIVGLDQASVDRLKAYLNSAGLEQRVRIRSKVSTSELINLVDLSSGVLFPSIYEGFGLPVVEAFARGKPVLVSNVSSLPEISNEMGIMCDPNSVNSILHGLQTMLANPSSETLVSARRNWAGQFTYKVASKAFDQMIDEIRE